MAGRYMQMDTGGEGVAYLRTQSQAAFGSSVTPSNLVRAVYDDTRTIDDIVACITAIRQEIQKRGMNQSGTFVQG